MAEFILKDWYGNNCTFDKDKIFVQDANGKLVEFTQGKGNPTLETLEVTENGTYTPSEGVDGFNNVVVEVPTPEITLQDKTITENGTYTADNGFDGLGEVTVEIPTPSGGTLVAKKINFTATGSTANINHGLGVIPLCALVFPTTGLVVSNLTTSYTMLFGFAMNEAAKNAMGISSGYQYGLYWRTDDKIPAQTAPSYTLESDRTNSCLFSNANENSITVGGTCKLKSGTMYTVYVIGVK